MANTIILENRAAALKLENLQSDLRRTKSRYFAAATLADSMYKVATMNDDPDYKKWAHEQYDAARAEMNDMDDLERALMQKILDLLLDGETKIATF